jgi:hypothetical protein
VQHGKDISSSVRRFDGYIFPHGRICSNLALPLPCRPEPAYKRKRVYHYRVWCVFFGVLADVEKMLTMLLGSRYIAPVFETKIFGFAWIAAANSRALSFMAFA